MDKAARGGRSGVGQREAEVAEEVSSGEIGGEHDRPVVPPGRQLFRLLVGVAVVAPERLTMALRLADEFRLLAASPLPAPAASPRHILIGALSSLPAWLVRAWARVDPAAQRWGGRAARWAPRLLPERFVKRPLRAMATGLAERSAAWIEIGRREELAGRHLVELGLQVIPDSVMSAVAESPDLRRVLRQQTAGMTHTVMERLRQTSAKADDLSESLSRRVFRRPARAPQERGR